MTIVNHRNISATFLALTLVSLLAASSFAACPDFFAGGKPPIITNKKMIPKYTELCNSGYAVGHSGLTRTPLWGAENLTAANLIAGEGIARHDNFRADTRLSPGDRSELKDYSRTGYDRGHIVNNRDMTPDKRDETFLLSNIVPQNSESNRGIWASIEAATRHEVKKKGQLYIITGVLFHGERLQSLKGKVMIPTALYKCLYDTVRQQAGCYVVANEPGAGYRIATVAEVELEAGLNLFPSMPAGTKVVNYHH